MKYFIDWSHDDEKFKVVDEHGKTYSRKSFKPTDGDEIITENVPMKVAAPWLRSGILVKRCNCHVASEFREKHLLEKDDDIDALVIKNLFEENPDNFDTWTGTPKLTALYRTFYQLQKERIAHSNRSWIFDDDDNLKKYMDKILDNDKDNEELVLKAAKEELKKYPIFTRYLDKIRGIGPSLSLGLVGIVLNKGIGQFDYSSSLRHYFGIHPVKHPSEDRMVSAKYKKGMKADFSVEYKSLILGRLADNLIKQNEFYKNIYDNYKLRVLSRKYTVDELKNLGYKKEKALEGRLSNGHAHNMAKRKMCQVFIDHLWRTWREIEGLPLTDPYPIAKLGHETYIQPPVNWRENFHQEKAV